MCEIPWLWLASSTRVGRTSSSRRNIKVSRISQLMSQLPLLACSLSCRNPPDPPRKTNTTNKRFNNAHSKARKFFKGQRYALAAEQYGIALKLCDDLPNHENKRTALHNNRYEEEEEEEEEEALCQPSCLPLFRKHRCSASEAREQSCGDSGGGRGWRLKTWIDFFLFMLYPFIHRFRFFPLFLCIVSCAHALPKHCFIHPCILWFHCFHLSLYPLFHVSSYPSVAGNGPPLPRGAAYEKDGQYALALADCSMCLSRDVGHEYARVRKSRVLEALGKEEDALSEVCAHLLLERDRVQAKVPFYFICFFLPVIFVFHAADLLLNLVYRAGGLRVFSDRLLISFGRVFLACRVLRGIFVHQRKFVLCKRTPA